MASVDVTEENIEALWDGLGTKGYNNNNTAPVALPKHVVQEKSGTTQAKGRRSWFETPPTKTLEIACEPLREKPGQRRGRVSEDEDVEVLTLTHFTNPPRVDFGRIKPGVTRHRQILVDNPHDYEQQVVVERIPSKKNFSVDKTEFVVEAECSVVLTIKWSPIDEGPYREMFLFLVDGTYRLQTIVFGTVFAPQPKRKERKGLLGSRVKKPFSVLHTPNFSNIKQSYTPRRSNSKRNVVLTGYSKQKSSVNVLKAENTGRHMKEDVEPVDEVLPSPGNASVVSNEEQRPAEKENSGPRERRSKHRNSVRRSTTYTKIGLTTDTPDRTTVISDKSPSATLQTSLSSGEKFACVDEGKTVSTKPSATEPCQQDIVQKLDFHSSLSLPSGVTQDSAVPTPSKACDQSPATTYLSPNTFVRENFGAISTPDQGIFEDLPTMAHMFQASDQSCQQMGKATMSQSGAKLQAGDTITMQSITFTQNTITMATPPANRSRAYTPQAHVSPMSFLRDSKSNTPDVLSVTSLSDKIPSPGLVLNNSVPHDIIVRQLGYVRKSLTGPDLPSHGWKPSLDESSQSQGRSAGRRSKGTKSSISKTRRRSAPKLTNQKKLFAEIPDTQSPRRVTYVVKNKNKTGNPSVQKFQKAGSRVIGKVMAAVNKGKTNRKSMDMKSKQQQEQPAIEFSPHKDSPGIVATPLEMPDESNPSRLTIVVKKPKVLKPSKSRKASSLPDKTERRGSGKLSIKTNMSKSPIRKSMSSVDSTTVTKTKPSVIQISEDSSSSCGTSTKSEPMELFPVSPSKSRKHISSTGSCDSGKLSFKTNLSKSPIGGVVRPVDSTTVIKVKPDVIQIPGKSDSTYSKQLFPLSPVPTVKVTSPEQESLMAAEFGTPQRLPTSPDPDTSRRGTVTVVKNRPSEALLKSNLSGKSLFEISHSPKKDLHVSWSSSTPIREGEVTCDPADVPKIETNGPSGWPVGMDTSFDKSAEADALSKISLEYVCSSSSDSSTNNSVNLSALCAVEMPQASLKYESSANALHKKNSVETQTSVFEAQTELSVDTDTQNPACFGDAKQDETATAYKKSPDAKGKKVSPSIDREERFISKYIEVLHDTPVCYQKSGEKSKEKPKVLRRQLAQTDIDVRQKQSQATLDDAQVHLSSEGACPYAEVPVTEASVAKEFVTDISVKEAAVTEAPIIETAVPQAQTFFDEAPVQFHETSLTVPSQKKRYHSDSTAIRILDKRQKLSNSSSSEMPKTRRRRATDSSIKSGPKRERHRHASRPGVAQSRLVLIKRGPTALPKHPMPFAAKNMYYDERWIEKQERGFVNWLNFILTPPEEYQNTAAKAKVDAGAVSLEPKVQTVRPAPTKEVLSLRAYAARRRMNRLRRASCRLYQTEDVVHVIRKLEAEVESYRITVRKDRMLHADVGLKQKILDLMLSYNSLWLRIGLETIYGEIIPLQSNSDVIGLSRFIITRLLGNPDIAMEFSHPTVPHLYRDGYQEAVSKHVLKKFLMLVYFLDVSKQRRLIDHNPCLFCKDAEWKSSKELLFQFSKDYLSGEGDITRHLGFLGYTVTQVQLPIDEFDYAVTNLAKDLRDGLRITRVIESLTQTWDLCKKLRVPAISRLQKVHNLEVTFKSLIQYSHISDPTDGGKVSPRDIVDGHREKTLALLWNIIFNFQIGVLIDEGKLRQEVEMLQKCLRARKDWDKVVNGLSSEAGSPWLKDHGIDNQICQKSEKLHLLLEWTRAVCAFYGLKIENFTVSFSDGRAFCYLVHHYYPGLLPLADIQSETSMMYHDKSPDLDDSFSSPMIQQIGADSDQLAVYGKLLANERDNFRVLFEKVSELGGIPLMVRSTDMSNTIPDEKVVVTYLAHLCSRLLDVQEEMQAARLIQTAWRRYRVRQQRQLNLVKHKSATVIQRTVRQYLRKRRAERQEVASVKIQTCWRGFKARQLFHNLKWEKANQEKLQAVRVLQGAVRVFLARCRSSSRRNAVLFLQAYARGYLVRKAFRRDRASRTIQAFYRNTVVMREARAKFIEKRNAAIVVQSAFRLYRNKQQRTRSAVAIQTVWRACRQRREYLKLRQAAICIQTYHRRFIARKRFLSMRHLALTTQRLFKGRIAMRLERSRFLRMKQSAILIQSHWRKCQQRDWYQRQRRATLVLQAGFRGYKARVKFLALRLATVIVQRQYRAQIEMRRCRLEYNQAKMQRHQAAVVLQKYVRGRRVRKDFVLKRKCIIAIQSCFRGHLVRAEFQTVRQAAVVIQRAFRNYQETCRKREELCRKSAVIIQSVWRMHKARQNYLHVRRAVKIIQSARRCVILKRQFLEVRHAAITIQRFYRAVRIGQAVRLELDVMVGAAVTIQCVWKGYVIRKQYSRIKSAAVTVQSWWRCCLQKRKFKEIQIATKIIQRHYRTYLEGQRVRNDYCRQKAAAVTFQRAWRRRVYLIQMVVRMQARRRGVACQRWFQRIRQSAVVIQRQFRAYQTSRQQKELLSLQNNTATQIQAAWRGYVVRKQLETERRAATCLQTHFRTHCQRQHYRKLRAAVLMLQAHYRAFVLKQTQRKIYLGILHSAVKIQSVFRAWRCHKIHKQRLAAVCLIQKRFRVVLRQRCEDRAAVVLQRRYRAHSAMKQGRQAFLQMKTSAVILQSAWRRYHARRSAQKLAHVVKIQSLVRGYQKRKRFLEKRRACVVLQTKWRGYACCKNYQQMLSAAVCLQRVYRSNKAAKLQRMLYLRERTCVIKLQALARGYMMRRSLQHQHHAATIIQSYFRSYSLHRDYLSKRRAAVFIQKRYRSCLEGKATREHYQKVQSSTLKIQATWRAYKQRQEFVKVKRSVILIQSWWKGLLQRLRYLKLHHTVLRLQERVRANQLTRKDRREFLRCRMATVCIQTAWRAYKDRKHFLHQKKAAVRIQACFRGYSARSRFRQSWWASMLIKRWWLAVRLKQEKAEKIRRQKRLEAAVKLQMWYKRTKEARIQRREFLQKRTLALRLQSYARGFLVRERMRKTRAAIVLQSYFRMVRKRQFYLQHRRAAVRIQAWVRSLIAKRSLERRRLAVRILQRNIRAYAFCSRVAKAAKVRDTSATKIQAEYRGYVQRRDFVMLRHAAIVIQKHFRRVQALKAYHYLLAIYEEHRQAKVARFILRARQELSALMIQRCYRRYRQLEAGRKHLTCVVCIQRWFRSRLVRLKYLRKRKAIHTIQGYIRQWREKRSEAARKIQHCVRVWLERCHQQKRESAATVLQARWRGYRARRRSSKELKRMLRRVQDANEAATEEKKLGQRTASALDYLLHYKQLAYILEALMHLEVVTRLSAECCLTIVEGNAVCVIYTLIRSCNRSVPHMELIKYSVSILLNLAKFDRTMNAVYQVEDSVTTLVDLMQIYREKGMIFSKVCMLMGILCLEPRHRQEILQDRKLVERIRSIHTLTARKQTIEDKRLITRSKLIAAKTNFNSTLPFSTPTKRFPKVRPDWLLRRDSLKERENPLSAINFVMETLHLTPKAGHA